MIRYFLYLFKESYKITNIRNFLTGVGIIVGIGSLICINVISSSFSSQMINNMTSNQCIIGIESSSYFDLDYGTLLNNENIQNKLSEVNKIDGVESFKKDETRNLLNIFQDGNSETIKMTYTFSDDLILIEKDEDDFSFKNHAYIRYNPEFSDIFKINNRIIINNEYFIISGLYDESENIDGDIVFPTYMKDKIISDDIEESGNYILTIEKNRNNTEISDSVISFLNKDLQEGFRFANFTRQLSSGLKESIDSITIFISLIGGISLIVASLNVINSMYMNVLEREKEIVILRTLGMNKREILLLFLCETLIIVLIYAAIGVLIGISIGYIVTIILNVNFSIRYFNLLLIILITFIFGVIAGIKPAIKASNMNVASILK